MGTDAKPKPPKHLKPATRRWFNAVVSDWELEQHHVRLLTLACEAWDRCQQAREVIEREGLTVTTRDGGAKLHPAARIEDACRIAFARLLRELDLDVDPPAESKRPPMLRSIRGGAPVPRKRRHQKRRPPLPQGLQQISLSERCPWLAGKDLDAVRNQIDAERAANDPRRVVFGERYAS